MLLKAITQTVVLLFTSLMLHRFSSPRRLLIFWGICLSVLLVSFPAQAAIDSYIRQYLQVREPIAVDFNEQGETRQFSAEDLSAGKQLFEQHCLNCHVGGATLPDPTISLSLKALSGATPPRDNILNLVSFLRQPMTYDGGEETFWCRQVPENWIPSQQLEKLAAFVIRAAQKAPGWGTDNF